MTPAAATAAPPRAGRRVRRGALRTGTIGQVVISALVRATAAAAAGLLLVSGLGLVLWTSMAGDDHGPETLLRGGVAAFASAHFMPVSIGGVPVTIHPLLITVIAIALITTAAARARPVEGRLLEALHGTVFAVMYGIVVDVVAVVATPAPMVHAGLAGPIAVGGVGVILALAVQDTAWRSWWRTRVPTWLRLGLRAGMGATMVMLTAGGVLLLAALLASFADVVAITQATGGSAGDVYGQSLLAVAFLPNALVAATGYASGAGFSLGTATFSPLAISPGDLPALPLLAAVPQTAGTVPALVVLTAPLLAAAAAAIVIVRNTPMRRDRLGAAAAAGATAAAALAVLCLAAGGGIADGPWPDSGASPLLTAALVGGAVVVVAVAAATAGGWRGAARTDAVADPAGSGTAT